MSTTAATATGHDPTSFSTSIGPGGGGGSGTLGGTGTSTSTSSNGTKEKRRTIAEEVASLVWNFVQAAGGLVDGMAAAAAAGPLGTSGGGGGIGIGTGSGGGTGGSGGGGISNLEDGEEADEVKLLRVRTRRFECVVVPGEYFAFLQLLYFFSFSIFLRLSPFPSSPSKTLFHSTQLNRTRPSSTQHLDLDSRAFFLFQYPANLKEQIQNTSSSWYTTRPLHK
jgi:hypothetical protein